MTSAVGQQRDRMPWWFWPIYLPFVPVLLLGFVVFLGPIALLSIIYSTIYPENHAVIYDWEGSERQKSLMAKLRSQYRQMTIWQRIGRGCKMWHRRYRRSKLFGPRYVPRMIRDSRERHQEELKEEQ